MIIENGILKPSGVIQMRGGTYAALSRENPLLARREIVVEIDTGKLKVGDGTHSWNDLPYTGGGSMEFPESDGNVYVIKDGEFVAARVVEEPPEWEPEIDDTEIVLAVDEDMVPYQLVGSNVEVNA